jgi:hypothetical protein
MLLCVRTTIDVDDDLILELKRVAAETRQSLKALIEDAIRSSLARRSSATRGTGNQAVLTFRGNGVRSGVNLDSMTELLDIMDGTP